MKKCTKCGKLKNLSEFPKNNRYKSGYNARCKSCCNEINKEYREKNKTSFSQMRKKYYQKNVSKLREEKRRYYHNNKEKKAEYDIQYRKLNKEKIKKQKKEWEEKNKDEPIFKIKRNLRRRVNHLLKNKKKADKTFNLIGCTPNFFKKHIENQFLDGMTWENYGEWHIDHKIPCYLFDLNDENEQRECFHYKNQRPLWAINNLKRSKNLKRIKNEK